MYTDPSGYSYLDEMINRNYMDGDSFWYRGEWVFNFQGGFFGSTSGKYFGGGTGYSYNWGTGQYTYNGQPVPFEEVRNNLFSLTIKRAFFTDVFRGLLFEGGGSWYTEDGINALFNFIVALDPQGQGGENGWFITVSNQSDYDICLTPEDGSVPYILPRGTVTRNWIDGFSHPAYPNQVFKVITPMNWLSGVTITNEGFYFGIGKKYDNFLFILINKIGGGGWRDASSKDWSHFESTLRCNKVNE